MNRVTDVTLIIISLICLPISLLLGQSVTADGGYDVLLKELKSVRMANIDLRSEILSLARLSRDARRIKGYEGLVISDAANRMACVKIISALINKTSSINEVQEVVERFPDARPDPVDLLDYSGLKIDPKAADSLRKMANSNELFTVAKIDLTNLISSQTEVSDSLLERVAGRNSFDLLYKVALTDFIQKSLIPVTIAFIQEGGRIDRINLADVDDVEPMFLKAVKKDRGNLLGLPVDLMQIHGLLEVDFSSKKSPLLFGYKL